MRKFWIKSAVTLGLLCSGAMAAFIQKPIPPSSQENYLQDLDGDGRLDGISLKFLGTVSREYLDQMVDSLTFDWLDSSESLIHNVVAGKKIGLDSSSSKRAFVNLTAVQDKFLALTGMKNALYSKSALGNVKMFLNDGTVYNVSVKDKMAPVMNEVVLQAYRNETADTLKLHFSESVEVSSRCESFVEFKNADNALLRVLHASEVVWDSSKTAAQLVLKSGSLSEENLAPRDSIRFLPGCVGDGLGNASTDSAKFVAVAGFFPMEVKVGSMVVDNQKIQDDTPIFQLSFEDVGVDVPNKHEWGIAMDVMGEEFLNAIKNFLGMPSKENLDPAKVKIQYNVRIYTNLGSFVVGTTAEVFGDDPRFNGEASRMFLKWNLMDGHRRHIGVGAYIANIIVHVSYNGQMVYRNDLHNGPTTQVFGVKRR